MSAGMMAMSRVIRRRSHGRSRMLRKPSMTIWPASVPVSVAFWPENSSATANSVLASVRAEQRRQQLIRVGDVRDVLVARAVERRRRHDENRAVEEEREHQRDRRVDRSRSGPPPLALARRRRTCASGRSTSADTGCAASRSRRGCRPRCRASRDCARSACWAQPLQPRRSGPAGRATARSRTTRRCPRSAPAAVTHPD